MPSYLWQLKQNGEISSEDYWDSGFRAELEETVKEELESELSGEETTKEVQAIACQIIDEEFE